MYVHRRCKLKTQELDMEKKAGGFCASCGQEGTIFHVIETDDWYQHILNGVLYTVNKGVEVTPMEPVWAAARLQTTKVKAARRGENWTEEVAESTPVTETAPEAELAKEDEVLEEVIEEAVEAEIEASIPEKEQPEETELEAEPEPSTNVLSGDIDIGPLEDKIAAKDTTIAELEARLAELEKAKK